MWYHYLIAAVSIYFVLKTLYSQFTTTYSSVYSRIPEVVGLIVSYFILKWCYEGIYAPPPMFGARRY
jgi:hypothetical protein